MLTVKYIGTLGNNLWQYAVGRTIAENYKLKFICNSIPGFPNTEKPIEGKINITPYKPMSGHKINFENIENSRNYMEGYFQRYEYIKNNKNQIKLWFESNVKSPINLEQDDLLLTIRRGWNGYPVENCPPNTLYSNIIEESKPKRIILCTDTFEDPYFNFLKKFSTEIVKASYSPLEQFTLIKSAKKIAISPSTYSWWASFLSDADTVYYPMFKHFIPDENHTNTVVDDEQRFKLIYP
jgi:hypothetical protein